MRRRIGAAALSVVALSVMVLCSAVAASGTASASRPQAATPQAPTPRAPTPRAPTPQQKLLIVMLENTSRAHAIDGMPRLAAMARTYGYATHYTAIRHPSLPNYLAVAGGSTFGVTDDAGPAAHRETGPSIFDRALAAGGTAKVYAESMPGNCSVVPFGRYAVKHNPWAYFSDPSSRANCHRLDVPSGSVASGALRNDVRNGKLPTVGMLVPNLCHDAHDCKLSVADGWFAGWIRAIQAAPDWRAGTLTVVVTFDEDDYSEGNQVLAVVLNPSISRRVVRTPLSHYSLTGYAAYVSGTPALRRAVGAPSLRAAFRLP